MASKRKREDDESEVTPCKTGRFASDEVKRSVRVRKKPARFVDDGKEGEREGETTDPSLTAEDIKAESPNSEEFTNVLQVHQKLPSPVKVCSDIGKLFQPTVPQESQPTLQEESSSLTTVTLPQLVPVILTPTEVKMEPGFPPSAEIPDMTNVKSTRVRKKSAKVLEMEEFEEAERTKSSKKSGKLTSPDPLLQLSEEQQTANIPGGVQHVLQASNIQMNLMSALKASPIQAVVEQPLQIQIQSLTSQSPQESATNIPGKKSSSKKKKADTAVSDADVKSKITLKIPKSKVKSADANMLNIGNESFSSDKYIKEEIEESINPNLLLSHSSEPVGHLMDMAIKTEPVSPVKVTKRSKTKKANPLQETGQVLPVSAGKTSQSSSVIKMLLNKPAQFSEPVVSTQSLTNIKALSSDSKTTKKSVKVKKESPMEESSGSKKKASIVVPVKLKMSPDSDASDLHISMLDDTSFTEESSLSQIRSEKKKVKKMTKKQSTPVQDDDFEEDDDDEDIDDDEDDGDDIDMIDDTLEDSLGWEFETQDGSLIIAEDTGKKAKKTNVKKKAKMKLSSKGSVHVDDTQTSYATKGKKFVIQREKKKKRLTAYTMWCNSVRAKVLNESPGMDFAQLSRRLGEIWQSVPSKDKTNWKRKAKREARRLMGKGLLITTGKKGSGGISSSTYVAASTETSTTSSTSSTPPPIQHPPIRHHAPKPHTTHTAPTVVSPKMDDATMIGAPVKGLGIEPIDTAAHLKLVGDSLSIIGMRLQEHRGLIAVQGSLSVLLDSLLCAVGPLMCLTTQVPELNGLPAETHTKVLDNIAYIMPGL